MVINLYLLNPYIIYKKKKKKGKNSLVVHIKYLVINCAKQSLSKICKALVTLIKQLRDVNAFSVSFPLLLFLKIQQTFFAFCIINKNPLEIFHFSFKDEYESFCNLIRYNHILTFKQFNFNIIVIDEFLIIKKLRGTNCQHFIFFVCLYTAQHDVLHEIYLYTNKNTFEIVQHKVMIFYFIEIKCGFVK